LFFLSFLFSLLFMRTQRILRWFRTETSGPKVIIPTMNFALLAGLVSIATANVSSQVKPEGYLAEPKAISGAGVLVLHPWWGLNGDVKAFCDRLAKSGFVAFAPDLFDGKVVATKDEAQALVDKYQPKEAELNKKILDAAMYLETKTTKKEIAVVGFSF